MNVTLYICPTGGLNADDTAFAGLISAHRAKKLARLNNPREKQNSLGAELCLAAISADCGLPLPPVYRCEEKGKPCFPISPPFFSLTHCEGFALGAVCDFEIGVDAEPLSRDILPGVLSRLLAPGEPCASPIKKWVSKESYIKLTGAGLSCSLKSFETTDTDVLISGKPTAKLCLTELCGLCICIAAYKKITSLKIKEVTPEYFI